MGEERYDEGTWVYLAAGTRDESVFMATRDALRGHGWMTYEASRARRDTAESFARCIDAIGTATVLVLDVTDEPQAIAELAAARSLARPVLAVSRGAREPSTTVAALLADYDAIEVIAISDDAELPGAVASALSKPGWQRLMASTAPSGAARLETADSRIA